MNVSGTFDVVHVAMTARERFLCALYNGPLLPTDAIAVFSGDGTVRLDATVGALRQRIAHHVLVSGGVDEPPHSLHADDMRRYLIQRGLSPDRIIMDPESANTREQSERTAELCREMDWQKLLLVASHYHMPRAFLTLLKGLQTRDLDVLVIPLPAPAKWWGAPAGLETARIDILADELRKIDEYAAKGHVASYEDGLAYLRRCEGGT
jgi:uncharacterized SAM-binding protein YcdF (DUF218 family)